MGSHARSAIDAYKYVTTQVSSSADADAALATLCRILAEECKRTSAIAALRIAALLREHPRELSDKDREDVRVVLARTVGAEVQKLDDGEGDLDSNRELLSIHINGLLVAAAAALKLSLEKELVVYIDAEEDVYSTLLHSSLQPNRPLYVIRKSLTLIARLLKSSNIAQWKPGSVRAIRESFQWLVYNAVDSINQQELNIDESRGDCPALAFRQYASEEAPSNLRKEVECIAVVLWLRLLSLVSSSSSSSSSASTISIDRQSESHALEELADLERSFEDLKSKLGNSATNKDYLQKVIHFVGRHGSDALLWESASLLHQLLDREPQSQSILLSSLIEQCVFDAQVIVDMLLESSTAEYVIQYFFLVSSARSSASSPLQIRDENAAPVLQELAQHLERAQQSNLFPYNVSPLIARLERIVN